MEQYGIVTEAKGETAFVSLQRHLACGNCGKCGLLSGAKKREVTVEVLNPIEAESGQRVVVESDDRHILFISFFLYIVPLIGLVAGIFLWLNAAARLGLSGDQDLTAVGVGLALMVLIFIGIRIWDRRVKDDPKYKPTITGIIEEEAPGECADEKRAD